MSGGDPNSLVTLLQKQIAELEMQLNFGWESYEAISKQMAETSTTYTRKEEDLKEANKQLSVIL